MRMVYGNYLAAGGPHHGRRRWMWPQAEPRQIIALRRETLGYVSQFLRVVPRVPTLDVVAEPLLALGMPPAEARDRAASLLRAAEHPRTAVVAFAHHLFGRRAAARQHRARLCPCLPGAASGRADRQP